MKRIPFKILSLTAVLFLLVITGCKPKNVGSAVEGDAASRVYVPPGKYDELYNFVSGGFSGQVSVYGIPSGRLLRVIPVFPMTPKVVMVIAKKQNQC